MTARRCVSLWTAVLVFTVLWLGRGTAGAETLYALTEGQRLVTFDTDVRTIHSTVAISGLGEDTLVGLDFRPATGELYALSNGNQFYKIDTNSGAASPVGNALSLIDVSKSFDFDPVNDTIRLVTTLRKNLRVNPNTGAIAAADQILTYAAGDPNFGAATQVVQAAYTNSVPGAVSSTLYNLEATRDVLTIQSPQNGGQLHTVGSVGVTLGTFLCFNGMDISGHTGTGYVVGKNILSGGMVENTLYTIDLTTGLFELRGAVAGLESGDVLMDVAVPVPEPSAAILSAIGAGCLAFASWRRRRARA